MHTIPSRDTDEVARVFSTAVIRELAREHPRNIELRLAPLFRLELSKESTLGDAFERAHRQLLQTYRNEYAYKNALVSKLIFGRHSPRTASAILEQPMGASEADVLVLNGTSTVYEIKSDFDQYSRLATQVGDYSTRAEHVNLVCSERRATAIAARTPDHVGVVVFRVNGALSTVRPSSSNLENLVPAHLFGMLRTAEAHRIIARLGGDVRAPGGELRQRLLQSFLELDATVAHEEMLRELRRRSDGAAELATSTGFPPSLRALAYSVKFSRIGARRLLERLRHPLTHALGV